MAETFKVVKGATVCVKGGSARGEVVELVGPNAVVVCGSKRLTLPVTMLTAEPTAKLKPARGGKPAGSPQVMPIMVIGLHVDEALSLVERAVDKALLAGQASLEIIHGHGTGALKQAIREQLAALPNVASVPADESGERFSHGRFRHHGLRLQADGQHLHGACLLCFRGFGGYFGGVKHWRAMAGQEYRDRRPLDRYQAA